MVLSDTTVLSPCPMCQHPTAGPAHTPANCTSNPANLMNGVRSAVVRICMPCSAQDIATKYEIKHLGLRPTPFLGMEL